MKKSITVTCYSEYELDKEIEELEAKGYIREGGVTKIDVSTEEDKKDKDYMSQQLQFTQVMVLDESTGFIDPKDKVE